MNLVPLGMPVLYMTACFEGKLVLPPSYFPLHLPPPPPFLLVSDLDFFSSTQLLSRALHCYKGAAERNK